MGIILGIEFAKCGGVRLSGSFAQMLWRSPQNINCIKIYSFLMTFGLVDRNRES
ncbi:MAG: hypothetical protein WBL95_22230 [Microcoleus sp.]